jgi:hypothetical protein
VSANQSRRTPGKHDWLDEMSLHMTRLKNITRIVMELRDRIDCQAAADPANCGEGKANLTLAIRHLEDAQSRLERAICRLQ